MTNNLTETNVPRARLNSK